MICDECGCDTMRQKTVRGQVYEECELCGARYGNASTLGMIEELAWAEENRVHPSALPLVLALIKVKGLRYMDSTGADAELGLAPSVYFQLAPSSYHYLDKLMKLADTFTPGSGIKWTVEVTTRSGVSFWLRPEIPLRERKPTGEEIARTREDAVELAELMERNMRLSWWEN